MEMRRDCLAEGDLSGIDGFVCFGLFCDFTNKKLTKIQLKSSLWSMRLYGALGLLAFLRPRQGHWSWRIRVLRKGSHAWYRE